MENFENKLNENYRNLKDILIQSIGAVNNPLTLVRIEQSVTHLIQESLSDKLGVRNRIDFNEAIKRFENHLKSSGKAESTIEQYLAEVKKFLNFLDKKQILLESTSLKVAEEYISELKIERKIKNNSLSKIVVTLKVFLKHLREVYDISIDAGRLKMPRKIDVVREVISQSETEKILCYLSNRKEKFYFENDRDMVVFKLGIFLGFRISEVIKINWEDIDLDNNTLFIHNAKGGKARKINFDDNIKDLLTKYRLETDFYKNAVVRGKCKKRITKCSLTKLINRIYKDAGVYRKGLCFHSMRHACAENLRRKGIDIHTISIFLGHADIRTTQMYLHSGDEDLKRIATVAQLP